jgi:nitroreductase
VSQDELRSLFEAARWAPSSYNEQPWRYVVATRDNRGSDGERLGGNPAGRYERATMGSRVGAARRCLS